MAATLTQRGGSDRSRRRKNKPFQAPPSSGLPWAVRQQREIK
jgi:hypothetical protein